MSQLIKALRPFASCDIGDALVKLKYPFGGYLDGISMWSPGRHGQANETSIIGEAVTVKMVEASDNTSPKLAGHFADHNESGKIMYIHQPPGMYSACFGGLMAARSKYLGAAGAVINGRFRDIGEIQGMEFPLFAKQSSILGSGGFTRASEVNVPVQFKDELWIHPGDILVGDQDGVVVVPPSLVEKVVELCAERKAIDDKIVEAILSGEAMESAMKRLRK